jgi:hypothetical protein
MPEEHAGARVRRSNEWWLSAGVVVLAVIFRSVFLLAWPLASFDSDQAVTGLMAKHLAEMRAFPVFYYGQSYMLAVEAWLAAPLFAIAGVSVTVLRLPLLVINLAIALLLFRSFVRETRLRPALAIAPTLLFALAAPGATARLLDANGGNVEPLLYVLLLWLTRDRPRWCGFIFAVGFLQREFLLYGLAALLFLEAVQGTLFTAQGFLRRAVMLRTAAITWLTVQWLKTFSSAAGPGTSMLDVYRPHDNLTELASRICFDLAALPAGAWQLVTSHWPMLFGVARQPVFEFGVDTAIIEGIPRGGALLAGLLLIPVLSVAYRLAAERRWRREYDFCAYLVLTAAASCLGYILGRCGQTGLVGIMRYEMLSLVGAAGLGAWGLQSAARWARRAWTVLAIAVVSLSAAAHTEMLAEYTSRRPVSPKRAIARQLEARGIRYARSDYWIAYAVTFLTNEHTKIASTDLVRIREYNRLADEHPDETVLISRDPCPGGHRVLEGIYFCRSIPNPRSPISNRSSNP